MSEAAFDERLRRLEALAKPGRENSFTLAWGRLLRIGASRALVFEGVALTLTALNRPGF